MQGEMWIYRPGALVPEHSKLDAVPDVSVLQKAVGGYIELVPQWQTLPGGMRCAAFCNDEGKLENLPYNALATAAWKLAVGGRTDDVLVGTVVVLTGDHEFMNAL